MWCHSLDSVAVKNLEGFINTYQDVSHIFIFITVWNNKSCSGNFLLNWFSIFCPSAVPVLVFTSNIATKTINMDRKKAEHSWSRWLKKIRCRDDNLPDLYRSPPLHKIDDCYAFLVTCLEAFQAQNRVKGIFLVILVQCLTSFK